MVNTIIPRAGLIHYSTTSGGPQEFGTGLRNKNIGDENSVFRIDALNPIPVNPGLQILDVDSDGLLTVGVDKWFPNDRNNPTDDPAQYLGEFLGYTVTGTDGVNYPVFGVPNAFGDINVLNIVVPAGTPFSIFPPVPFTTNRYDATAGDEGENLFLCFAVGTLIAVPNGERAVEALAIGDEIMRADGATSSVKWIGRQTMNKFVSGPRMQPVRIRAGALGGGLPHSDLTVTADHGMMIDGYVINAGALVNGHSIDFVPMEDLEFTYTVYHIETEAHDVILANGAPSETFVDTAGRSAFDNYQEYLDLYGVDRMIPEMTQPRIASTRLVPQAIQDRLSLASEDPGVAQPHKLAS